MRFCKSHLLALAVGVKQTLLTVQPFGIIFDSPLERVYLLAGRDVVQVRPEDDCIRFRELGHRSAIQSGQSCRVTRLWPWKEGHQNEKKRRKEIEDPASPLPLQPLTLRHFITK